MTEREMLQYMLNGEVLCRGVDVVDPKLYDEYGVDLEI